MAEVIGGINYSLLKQGGTVVVPGGWPSCPAIPWSVILSTINAVLTPSSGVSVTAPQNGVIVVQFILSTPVVPIIAINGATSYLNSGNPVAGTALYEFAIHVASGDAITILASGTATAYILRVFYRYTS